MTANNFHAGLLEPSVQDEFWGAIDPDIRKFLDSFETAESWTYEFEELPELFVKVSSALPKVAELPPSDSSQKIIRELILLLASMPMRQSVSALAWLDNRIMDETDIGWGVICYMEAADIFRHNKSDDIYLQAKVIHERIQVMLASTLSSLLFCNIK